MTDQGRSSTGQDRSRRSSALADGEWHRLHPATPLLKGGFALVVVLGYAISNLRERLFGLLIPDPDSSGPGSDPNGQETGGHRDPPGLRGDHSDPFDYIFSHHIVIVALLVLAALIVLLVGGFSLSWRVHTFRITDQVVEVRSGIIFRVNRKARLDRIQGIHIVRPFVARLLGAAKLEVSQAGHSANVHLSYLASGAADELRVEILRRASGAAAGSTAVSAGAGEESSLAKRIAEFAAPELDESQLRPESVVRIHLGRLFGSIVLGTGSVIALLIVAFVVVWVSVTGQYFVLFFAFPSLIGFGGYYFRRFSKSLRYTISGTADGVRVGFGLLSTSNETLPPGRIHSIEITQPPLWRFTGWWQIRVNRASHTSGRGAANEANTTILPVGTSGDVGRVLRLMLPDLIDPDLVQFIERAMVSAGGDVFRNSPRRAMVFRPLSWRRNGFAFVTGSILLRTGIIRRKLVVVPQPRLQSVALHQGPLARMCSLATVELHTVTGPIRAKLTAIDQSEALSFFEKVADVVVSSGQSDTSHRWRSGEVAQ